MQKVGFDCLGIFTGHVFVPQTLIYFHYAHFHKVEPWIADK